MKSRIIFLLATLGILFGCAQNEPPKYKSHKSEKWTDKQSAACDAMSINGLLGLNGKDLYFFPRCLSGEDSKGNLNYFNATNLVMEKMGIEAIDQAMDLVKIDVNNDGELPLMSSLLVLLERGTVIDGKSNKALHDKMFLGEFQDFLLGMDPYWASHLALQMAQSGQLKLLLDDLTPLVNTIDMAPLLGNFKTSLDDKMVKDSVVHVAERVLDTPALYDSLKNVATFEESRSVLFSAQEEYLSDWLDPQINDFAQTPIEQKDLSSTHESGLERYNRFIANLTDDEINKVAKLSSLLFERFATMDPMRRLGAIKKLFDGFSEAYTEQAAPVRNLMALIDFLTNKAKTIDLQHVIRGIDELLKGTGPAAILSLNHKIGSAKLHSLADRVLYEGGKIPGCRLELTGVKRASVGDYDAILESIATFVEPNESCAYGLSPLASLIYDEIQTSIASQTDCQGELCLTSSEMEKVAGALKGYEWHDVQRGVSADSLLVKEFLTDILKQQLVLLQKDTYALYWDHLSLGTVPVSVMEKLIDLIDREEELTAARISQLDELIETSDEFKKYFHPFLLESLVTNKVAQLSATAEQFGNIFAPNSGEKADRLFSGTYLGGPLYQLVTSELALPELEGQLQLPRVRFRAKELLTRLKRPGAIFKNGRLDHYEDNISIKYLGERTRSVEFIYEKKTDPVSGERYYEYTGLEFGKEPLTLDDVFSEDYWRFKSLLVNDRLLGKDISDGQSDQFNAWVENKLYPHITSGIDWNWRARTFNSFKNIDTKYYDVEAYSVTQQRKIALFYSKNFMNAPAFLPRDEQTFQMERKRTKKTPNVRDQFVALPHGSGDEWSAFNLNYPKALSEGIDLDVYLNTVTKEQLDAINWQGMPEDKYGKYELQGYSEDDSEIIKLLSTLNLLTVNRSKEYMPLIALGNYCFYKGEFEKCPITFVDGQKSRAIESFRSYIKEIATSYACPLISGGDAQMIQMLGLPADLNCSGMANLFESQQGALPNHLHKQILKDIFAMGKKAQLKSGLTTLGSQIRYHRLAKKYPGELYEVMRGLTNSWGFLPQEMTAYAHKQMADHKGFLVYRPGFLNVYINYLIKKIAAGGYAEDLLSYYGAEVLIGDDLTTGIGQTLIDEVLIGTYNEIDDKNVSVLDYLFRVIQKLAKPQYQRHLQAIANIVSYPQDLEALSTYTLTLPLLIKHLASYNLPQTFWNRPGNFIIRNILLHQEKMRSLNDLLLNFDANDIYSSVKAVVETFHVMGSSEEINILAKKFVHFLRDEMIACNADGVGIIKIFENSLRSVMLEDAVDDDFRSANNLIQLLGSRTVGFDGKEVAAVVEQIEPLFAFGIRAIPNIVSRYQKHLNKNPEGENYFHELAHSLIDPLEGFLGDVGSKALVAMLSSVDIASWDALVKPLLFEKEHQEKLISLMKASDKVELSDYQNAVEESNELLAMAHLYLNYASSHMKWSSDSAKYIMESMLRLSGQDDIVLDKQILVLDQWFLKAQKNK